MKVISSVLKGWLAQSKNHQPQIFLRAASMPVPRFAPGPIKPEFAARRKARRAEPEELVWGPEPEPDQAEVLETQQETERLGRALAALPAPQRTLIERAFYGDLSHSEIAAETGLPLGTIKSRIRLALEKLRHQMS